MCQTERQVERHKELIACISIALYVASHVDVR